MKRQFDAQTKITVEVTQEDLALGDRSLTQNPVARAVFRALQNYDINYDEVRVRQEIIVAGRETWYIGNNIASTFLEGWNSRSGDSGEPGWQPEPFTFELGAPIWDKGIL